MRGNLSFLEVTERPEQAPAIPADRGRGAADRLPIDPFLDGVIKLERVSPTAAAAKAEAEAAAAAAADVGEKE